MILGADTLAELGAKVPLAHPLGVKAFSYRRVKMMSVMLRIFADLLRMGRLPEAWITPAVTRELRALVRHRAKLVALRSNVKCHPCRHPTRLACQTAFLVELLSAVGKAMCPL
jgi:rRNA-processing protein FCF1